MKIGHDSGHQSLETAVPTELPGIENPVAVGYPTHVPGLMEAQKKRFRNT